ncbi:glycosyltransferase family 4 protein [Neobacillus sp. MM2021_6]|uniref:glycosyltransferase family 4 protein n=1 Tax=Bacillaceae TaxID=186817 RepID=UPI00140E0BF3|nr:MULTISPECIES: glycosyltransferase family 4 protein [Bacillaceae]MBO0961645.1 glycosyltransferase family 4 protein [Neobacillus sp. MM2021_6]NHC21245.1 glycosyltransferase family 4 protein [Bacillus sp. MM2020_4]
MKIVLINHYAGSNVHGMEYRPYYLAKEWVKSGHEVTIIGASYSHIRTIQPEMTGRWKEEFLDGIRYIWIKTPPYEGNGAKRIINMMIFLKALRAKASFIAETYHPDVVIASSTYPLDIYPARKIAKKAGAKLIFEVHDLWPLSPMELGNMSAKHPFIMVMQKGENDAYAYADTVVSLLPKADQHMIEHGLEPGKFRYLPNGIDVEQWNDAKEKIPEDHMKLIQQLKAEGKFLVGYAGTHGIANALEYMIDAAELVKDEPVAFILVGKGPERETLIQKAKERNLTNIHFLPVINKKAIPDFLAHMDALYIGWRRSPLYRFGVSPNKLLDYLMAGRPIIHGIEAGNDLVAEAEAGISIEPENPKKLAEAVIAIKNYSPVELNKMGSNGKKFVSQTHDYHVLSQKFIDIMNEK